MNIYKRTNFNEAWSTSKGHTPLVWTTDSSKGFKSLRDCYLTYYFISTISSSQSFAEALVNINNVDSKLTNDPNTFYEKQDWTYNETIFDQYINDNIIDFKAYQKYEDQYNCSGMCHAGLFYYSNPLTYGPPSETCLRKFMHHLDSNASPFANTCIVTGVLCILLSLMQFAMYHRPELDVDSDPNAQLSFSNLFNWSSTNNNSDQDLRSSL